MPTDDSQKQHTIDIQDRDIWLLEAIAKMRFMQAPRPTGSFRHR